MYQIVEFFTHHPRATVMDAADYFAKELEISTQVAHLKKENPETLRLRASLRPLYGAKRDIDEEMKYIISDIEGEVMVKYPPRQGTENQRDQLRAQLKKSNAQYQHLETTLRQTLEDIYQLEQELEEIERNAKNARRITELYTVYMTFINEFCKNRT